MQSIDLVVATESLHRLFRFVLKILRFDYLFGLTSTSEFKMAWFRTEFLYQSGSFSRPVLVFAPLSSMILSLRAGFTGNFWLGVASDRW